MAFVVVYDANVLYPSLLRDVLIRVAQRGLVRARWTDAILDEVFDNLIGHRPGLDTTKLARTRELMNASIRVHAQMIVTSNTKDFPDEELSKWDIEAKHPDDFLVDQFHLDAIALHVIVQQIADVATRPPMTFADALDSLEKIGITQATALLRR